jgi:hypothetical protein
MSKLTEAETIANIKKKLVEAMVENSHGFQLQIRSDRNDFKVTGSVVNCEIYQHDNNEDNSELIQQWINQIAKFAKENQGFILYGPAAGAIAMIDETSRLEEFLKASQNTPFVHTFVYNQFQIFLNGIKYVSNKHKLVIAVRDYVRGEGTLSFNISAWPRYASKMLNPVKELTPLVINKHDKYMTKTIKLFRDEMDNALAGK